METEFVWTVFCVHDNFYEDESGFSFGTGLDDNLSRDFDIF